MTSLLPANATALERALEAATASLGQVETPLRDLWNPQTCPARFLPWLAWSVSVDVWEDDWDEATKRAVIAASIPIHRRKGTVRSVELSLAPLGLATELVEWWQVEPTETPGTFKVRVTYAGLGPTLTLALNRAMRAAIDRSRPASRAYGIQLVVDAAAPVVVGGAERLRVHANIGPHPADAIGA